MWVLPISSFCKTSPRYPWAPAHLIVLSLPPSGLHINQGGWLERAKTAGRPEHKTASITAAPIKKNPAVFQIHAGFPQWSTGTNGFEKNNQLGQTITPTCGKLMNWSEGNYYHVPVNYWHTQKLSCLEGNQQHSVLDQDYFALNDAGLGVPGRMREADHVSPCVSTGPL